MSNERAPWEIEDDEVLAPWEVDDTQEESAPWEIADDEDLLPQPFYLTQPDKPVEEKPSEAFTNPGIDLSGKTVETQEGVSYYVEDSRGRTDGTVEDTANYEQRYKEDGAINHGNPYWSQFGNGREVAKQMELDKENGTTFPSSYVNVGETQSGGETEGVQSQEVSNEAGKETATNQITNIFKDLSKDPKWSGKSDEEIWEAAKLKYAEDAGETAFMALTLPAGLGKGILSTALKSAALLGGEEAVGEVAKVAAGGDVDLIDSAKEVGKGAAVGAALGGAGHYAGETLGWLAKKWDDLNGTTALEKINKMGKATKQHETTKGRGSPDDVDHIVGDGVSAADVIVARDDVSNLLKMNENGAKLGTQSLSRATENPAVQELLSKAATKTEKVVKAIPGEGSIFKEKVLENVGLRSKNLRTDRADAIKAANHKVDNELDEVIDLVSKDVKEGALSKEILKEVKTYTSTVKGARAAAKAGNLVKYKRLIAKAEKQLKSITKEDDFLGEILTKPLISTKTSSKLISSATDSKENPLAAELLTLGAGGATMFSDMGITGGLGTMAAVAGGRKMMNKQFSKSANKRSEQVEKALKGNLGALKSKYKALNKLQGKGLDGALLRAYMALEEDK